MNHTKSFELDLKGVADDGAFTGYASTWATVDSYGERVEKGAFVESIAMLVAKGRKLPILWQHNVAEPLGAYDVLREDAHGLYVSGKLLKGSVNRATEAHALMQAGAITGLSIGYREKEHRIEGSVRVLTNVELYEASLVTFPANPDARVVRAEDINSKPELARFLQEHGFAKAAAVRLAAGGWPALSRGDNPDHSQLAARVLAAAEQLRTTTS